MFVFCFFFFVFFQAEDGIRDLVRSRGLGDVYKRQLDGGHLVMVLYEMITRRKPSDKFLEYSQIVGMILLLGLVFLAFGNDIYRLFT